MLHAMHYFMSRILVIQKSSAKAAIAGLRLPMQFPYEANTSSKLLNLQLKSFMHLLISDLTGHVLEGLEKELRTRAKASWATSLCVILILSMCIEAIQIAADGYIVQAIINQRSTASRKDIVIEICRLLDDHAFSHCMGLFHTIYH